MINELIQVDQIKANEVLNKIDDQIVKLKGYVKEAESGFMSLAFLLIQAKRGAYWTLRGHKTEHEYVQVTFPQSRAQYYRLIRIGTHLSGYDQSWLETLGSSKCEDLVRVHLNNDGTLPKEWKQHVETDDKDSFRRRVRGYLDGKDASNNDPNDPKIEDHFITFRIFGNGIHAVNTALETMGKIAGTDKSLGLLLEDICANFCSQFAEDGTGHVAGKNSFILSSVGGLVQQLDFSQPDTSQMLIGIVGQAIEANIATPDVQTEESEAI